MGPTGSERTGVFVARVWIEDGADELLRARITQTVDVEAEEAVVLTTACPEEVYCAIRTWLEAFLVHSVSTVAIGGTW